MQKGTKNLVLLCGVAVALCAAYGGLTAWNSYSEKKQEEKEAAEEEAAKIYLCEVEQASQLEISNENGSFSFTWNSENETWGYDKDEKFPKQSKVTAVTGKLESLLAVRQLEEVDEDLSVYGLDEPAYTMLVTDSEGTEISFEIGDASEVTGDYYLRMDGGEAVYTVASSLITALDLTEDDLLDAETYPTIVSSNISSLTWTAGADMASWEERERAVETTAAETESETELTETRSNEEETTGVDTAEENTTEEDTAGEAPVEMENYWVRIADGVETEYESMDDLLSAVTGLSYADCADYYMEETEMKPYGLVENGMVGTLTVAYTSSGEEKTLVLTIGGKTEDETAYYVKTQDSDMVNLIESETMESLLTLLGVETEDAEEESVTTEDEEETVTEEGATAELEEETMTEEGAAAESEEETMTEEGATDEPEEVVTEESATAEVEEKTVTEEERAVADSEETAESENE